MTNAMTLLLATAAAALLVSPSSATNCKGCTPLDEHTFDKLVDAFRVSVVKFDTAYPYGDKHDEFAKVALEGADLPDFFVGEVGIKDYGDKDNEALGKKFSIVKDDYPAVMMFVRQSGGKPREEFKFTGEFNAANLKNFIRQNSGVYMPLAGCIEEFDKLADRMVKAGDDKSELEKILKEAEAAAAKLTEEKQKKKADNYVKIMKKIVSDGKDFVAKERERTEKMRSQKISDHKKQELGDKLNVLLSFVQRKEKDEL